MEQKNSNLKNFISKNKGMLIALVMVLILVIVAVVLLVVNNNNKETAIKESKNITANTNAGIVEETEYEGLKFANVSLIKDKKANQYTLTTDVTNTTKETLNTKQVDIVLKNKDGNKIITLLGYIGENLKPNETRTVTASTSADTDLSKATIKEITAHK